MNTPDYRTALAPSRRRPALPFVLRYQPQSRIILRFIDEPDVGTRLESIPPGTRFGPYEILAPIGKGGMGVVYRARDTRLRRDVAIKVLTRRDSRTDDVRERILLEARIVARLSHPNICTLYDVGSADQTDFLVMELLEGESLSECIRRGCWRSPKTDHLCSMKIDQGWTGGLPRRQ